MCGYHLYQSTWTAGIGKSLVCEREPINSSDRYEVAVLKDDVVVSHLPRKLSWILSLFLLRNGTIDCVATGGTRYSTDLPQGDSKYLAS